MGTILQSALKFLTGSATPYLMIFLLLAGVAGGAGTYIEHLKVVDYEAKYAQEKTELQEAIDANGSCQATVTSLSTSLKLWKDSATAAAAVGQNAAKQAEEDKLTIQTLNSQLALKEASDNGNLTCSKLLSSDLAAMCPGHAAAMRVRTASSVSRSGSQ